ncbi:MAG TPA: hypothetical protein VJ784_03190 [Pyrinomonadaceae bacterium]|nr:hypothetical protein [Pyrinomonadaceae bacterium]
MTQEVTAWQTYLIDAIPPTLITIGVIAVLCIVKAASSLHKELDTKIQEVEGRLSADKPKIEGEIQSIFVTAFSDWVRSGDGKVDEFKEVGLLATLRVFLINKSPIATTLKHVSLRIDKAEDENSYGAFRPEDSDILRRPWDSRKPLQEQDTVENLACSRRVLELGRGVDGYLQFKVHGMFLNREGTTSLSPVLIVTDAWGETHEILYKRGVPLLPSQIVLGYQKPNTV